MAAIRTRQLFMESLKEFTQNTTFHGIRYICGPNISRQRRLMWLIFVLASTTAVVLQIVDRVVYFYSRPIGVNMKINYNQTLDFPAVTICNQNAFRASKAAEYGKYRLIEQMFSSSQTMSLEELGKYNATDLSLELYTSLAHTKEDFIVNCMWKNKGCSHNDFDVILTDHGVCYIFKKEKNEVVVSSSGVESGLRLTLNVEQYEYMTGPHDAAGIKMLLHDAREIPFVHELGQAVPTGTHAFVGVKFMTIDNLPKPYGECDSKELAHTDIYTTEECYLDCLVTLAKARCGCRDIYMPDPTGTIPVCTLGKYFACLQVLKVEFSTTLREKCGCPVPCYVAIYDPFISYASMSNHLVSKLLTSSEATSLATRLENALEITSKMDNDTFEYFKSIANVFHSEYFQLKEVIASISNCLSDQKNVTEDIFAEMADAYEVKERIYRYQDFSIKNNFLRPRDSMEERTVNSVTNAHAEFAMVNKRRILRLANANDITDENRLELYELITDELTVKQEIVQKAHENMIILVDAFIIGKSIFWYKFEDLPRSHNKYIVPKKLMKYAMNYNDYMKKHVPKLNFTDFDIMHSTLDKFIEQATIAYKNQTINESRLNYTFERFQYACRSFLFSKNVVYTQGMELPARVIQERLSNFRSEWAIFNSDIVDLRQNMNALTTMLRNITMNILPDLDGKILQISNYTKQKNGQLMQLTHMLLSNETKLMTNILKNFFQEIQSRGQQIQDSANLLRKPIKTIWTAIISDEDSIEYYNFTNNALFLRNLSTVLDEWNEKVNKLEHLDVRRRVFNKDEDFFGAYDEITLHLEKFKHSIVVDDSFVKQNFLQLDIFYRQLSFEHISQHKAYDFFALVCDIGGAMGLFIGASMLTVVEIIDLFLLQLPVRTKRCCELRKTSHLNQSVPDASVRE